MARRSVPAISTDLFYLCLVPSGLVVPAIEQIGSKFRVADEPRIRAILKWYGSVVNINPCIFNFMGHAFEKVSGLGIKLAGRDT
jgi:hypothetical protein